MKILKCIALQCTYVYVKSEENFALALHRAMRLNPVSIYIIFFISNLVSLMLYACQRHL